jgi:hypothetical protein
MKSHQNIARSLILKSMNYVISVKCLKNIWKFDLIILKQILKLDESNKNCPIMFWIYLKNVRSLKWFWINRILFDFSKWCLEIYEISDICDFVTQKWEQIKVNFFEVKFK